MNALNGMVINYLELSCWSCTRGWLSWRLESDIDWPWNDGRQLSWTIERSRGIVWHSRINGSTIVQPPMFAFLHSDLQKRV
jgi:hypothetical protein